MNPNESTTPVLRKSVSMTADADLIAAVSGKSIRILSGSLSIAVTGTITFKSGSTALTGAITLTAGTPLPIHYTPVGAFQTVVGESFNVDNSGTDQISGWLVYQLIGGG
jgi:hypothetical protein